MGPEEGGVTPLRGAKADLTTMQSTAQKSSKIAGEIKADHQRIDGELSAVWTQWQGEAARVALQVWHGELSPQLDSLQRQLNQIAQTVQDAMTSYANTDTNQVQSVRAAVSSPGGITASLNPQA